MMIDENVLVDFTHEGIRKRRKELGLSLKEIGEITGISWRTLENYEKNPETSKGARKPREEHAQLLSECLLCYFRIPRKEESQIMKHVQELLKTKRGG